MKTCLSLYAELRCRSWAMRTGLFFGNWREGENRTTASVTREPTMLGSEHTFSDTQHYAFSRFLQKSPCRLELRTATAFSYQCQNHFCPLDLSGTVPPSCTLALCRSVSLSKPSSSGTGSRKHRRASLGRAPCRRPQLKLLPSANRRTGQLCRSRDKTTT